MRTTDTITIDKKKIKKAPFNTQDKKDYCYMDIFLLNDQNEILI